MEFAHDGTRLASGADDGAIIVWDVATGFPVEQLSGHAESVRAVAFGLDDDTLYSAATDRRLLAWDLRGDRRFIPRLATSPDPVGPGTVSAPSEVALAAPDGEAVVYLEVAEGRFGNTMRFLDVAAGRLGAAIVTDDVELATELAPDRVRGVRHRRRRRLHSHVWDWRRGTVIEERHVTPGRCRLPLLHA